MKEITGTVILSLNITQGVPFVPVSVSYLIGCDQRIERRICLSRMERPTKATVSFSQGSISYSHYARQVVLGTPISLHSKAPERPGSVLTSEVFDVTVILKLQEKVNKTF